MSLPSDSRTRDDEELADAWEKLEAVETHRETWDEAPNAAGGKVSGSGESHRTIGVIGRSSGDAAMLMWLSKVGEWYYVYTDRIG